MTEQISKWPESLPAPCEIVEGPGEVVFTTHDLEEDSAIRNLVHDLYWFQDDEYFLYSLYGHGVGQTLNMRLKTHGVMTKKTEMYFYRHPKPAHENDFIRVTPHSDVPQWMKDAAQGEMYARGYLTLEAARRKQLDFREAARVATNTMADNESVVEAKPNFFGLGLNLNSLWRIAKRWLNRKKRSNITP